MNDLDPQSLKKELASLQELMRMRLVAISVASLANTPEAAKQRLPRQHEYWTPAYQDVCDAVDREMKLIQKLYAD